MVKHKQTGYKGEQEAAIFLQKKGYIILEKNWRSGKKEIDIIATFDGVLVFVEVKTRSTLRFAFPEEFVTPAKQRLLRSAAAAYFDEHTVYKDYRFDVISLLMNASGVMEIVHFEYAF